MARRKQKTNFELTIQALSRLPWRVCLALAPIAWFGFHLLSNIESSPALTMGGMGSTVFTAAVKTIGLFGQIIAPAALLLAALISWLGQRRRAALLEQTKARHGSAPLQQLTWRQFEQLVAAHFERKGYTVQVTPDGADGGVDVVARKGSETFLIQCKQWRATQIGVSVVRELFGVMTARGSTGAYVVSIGAFSKDAKAFAEGRNIELVDAHTLLPAAASPQSGAATLSPPKTSTHAAIPTCPKCGADMARRVARQAANSGQAFYGCSTYPKCRGTLPIN